MRELINESDYHVYPIDDLREHDTSGDRECWCRPELNEFGCWLHHAMDQREKYERGELKYH